MDISASSKFEELKQSIFQELSIFKDRTIDINKNVSVHMFQELFKIELNNFKTKIDYKIDAVAQECSRNVESEPARFEFFNSY